MTLFLPDYSYGSRMVLVARSETASADFMARGVDFIQIQEETIVFQPDGLRYDARKVKEEKLAQLCDYDIVEIGANGLLYRAFANQEADSTVFMGGSCNSNCIMCPASDAERRKGFSYSREQLIKYLEYLPENLEYLVITGGEPTMQTTLFLEVLERVHVKYPNTNVLLLTNGRSLSDEWLFHQVVERSPHRFRIAIPVHASGAQLHDAITRAEGSFTQTLLGLTRLMDSTIDVEIRIVVTRVNCHDLLPIARLITERFPRVKCVNFIGLEPRGNCALHFNEVYLDHQASFQCSKAAIEHLMIHGYDVGLYNYPLCALDRDFWPLASKSISAYKNVYHADCASCTVRSICAGFFATAMSIAKPQVYPLLIRGVNA